MYSLYYLAYLVQTKNDLNRKRRRFHALMNPGTELFKLHPHDKRVGSKAAWKAYDGDWYCYSQKKQMHPAYSHIEAHQGYLNAQKEMRAMTKHMRAVCKDLGAKLMWGSGGQIYGIKHENKVYKETVYNRGYDFATGTYRIVSKTREIEVLVNHYLADKILINS